MRRSGLILVAAVIAGGALVTSASLAGFKTSQAVVISTASRFANGDLGYVHNTADTTQMITCSTHATTAGTTASCYAKSAAGLTLSCSTSAASLVSAVQSLNGDSHLLFYANEAGQCTQIQVRHSSVTRPKSP